MPPPPALLRRHEVSLLPIHGKQVRDHLPAYGKGRTVAVSFLPLAVIDHGELVTLSWCQLGSLDQCTLDMLIALF